MKERQILLHLCLVVFKKAYLDHNGNVKYEEESFGTTKKNFADKLANLLNPPANWTIKHLTEPEFKKLLKKHK